MTGSRWVKRLAKLDIQIPDTHRFNHPLIGNQPAQANDIAASPISGCLKNGDLQTGRKLFHFKGLHDRNRDADKNVAGSAVKKFSITTGFRWQMIVTAVIQRATRTDYVPCQL